MMNVDTIADTLRADATLLGSYNAVTGYSGLATGGIYTKKLKREKPAATPDAFTRNNAGAEVVRPSIVILDRGDTPHRQRNAIPAAYQQEIFIYFYAQATQSGKDTITAMRQRVYELIDHAASGGWTFATEMGPIAFVDYIDRSGIRDDENFSEAVVDYCRYVVTSRHANLV